MSINEMDSKIKELRELRRMADELAASASHDGVHRSYRRSNSTRKLAYVPD